MTYLVETSRVLWPAPAEVTIGRRRPSRGLTQYVMVPSASDPRLLVPTTPRRAAAAAVLGYNKERSRRARIRSRALWAMLASGVGQVVLRDRLVVRATPATARTETIETYLRAALADDVVLSWHIGPARANRKPVLQLLTPAGRTVGFAKIGISALTRELVRAERRNLESLARAPLGTVTAPRVLHFGRWQDLDILVQEALPVRRRRDAVTQERLVAAMLDVASVDAVTSLPVAESPYWAQLRARLDRIRGDAAQGLGFVLDRLRAAGTEPVRFGAWHGDWTPWNMAVLPGTTLVWDWERFATGVPLGFDALHYALQDAIVRQRVPPPVAAAGCLSDAPRLLAPFGIPPERSEQVALLYLVEIATRYLLDDQAAAGSRLGRPDQWLLPEIMARAARLTPAAGGN